MAISNISDMVTAENNGQSWQATWRKAPTQTTGANIWFDLSMSPGNPVPNYYIGTPNTYTPQAYSLSYGLPVGMNVSPSTKLLKQLSILNTTAAAIPSFFVLYDMVGFYPFLDESTGGVQPMTQTTPPSRWYASSTATFGSEILTQVPVSGTTGFTAIANCSLSNPGNAITMTASAAAAWAGQTSVAVTVGQTYRCEFNISSMSSASGSLQVNVASSNTAGASDMFSFTYGNTANINQNFLGVTRSFSFIAKSSTVSFQFGLTGNSNGDTVTLTSLSLQSTTSTVSPSLNKGLQLMPVVVAAHSGTPVYFVQYTNQDGVPNRWTTQVIASTQVVNGTVMIPNATANLQSSPFLQLQTGDTGVRSMDGILFTTVDVGLISMALVYPTASFQLRTIDAPVEKVFFMDAGGSVPVIQDDAYLNLVCLPNGNLSGSVFHGMIQSVWG